MAHFSTQMSPLRGSMPRYALDAERLETSSAPLRNNLPTKLTPMVRFVTAPDLLGNYQIIVKLENMFTVRQKKRTHRRWRGL